MKKSSKYLKIFTTCIFLSSFTFGGGYVIIPLMRRKFVQDLKWLEETEMLDITAIAQSSPGSIALNAAILLGYKVGGLRGVIFALLGTLLPPLLIVTIISIFYDLFQDNEIARAILKGMQAGVAALLCDISITVSMRVVNDKKVFSTLLMIVAFILIFFFNFNLTYIILACIMFAILLAFINHKKNKKDNIIKRNDEVSNISKGVNL